MEIVDHVHAIIRRRQGTTSLAMADIAGRPLILRQLQWLHANGCAPVAVEVRDAAEGMRLREWLVRDALGARAEFLIGTTALSLEQIRRRHGWRDDTTVIAIEDNVLGDCLLRQVPSTRASHLVTTHAPPRSCGALEGATVACISNETAPAITIAGGGWVVALRSVEDAMSLGMAALEGSLPPRSEDHPWPIMVHAAPIARGIWLAHGARVSSKAALRAPVLIGEHSRVERGATVGPRVVVAPGARIDAHAAICDAYVTPGSRVRRDATQAS